MVRGGWKQTRWAIVALGAALALATTPGAASRGGGRAPLEFDVAQIRIEKNATARDAGIQMLLDAEDWKRVAIYLPLGGPRIMQVRANSSVGRMHGPAPADPLTAASADAVASAHLERNRPSSSPRPQANRRNVGSTIALRTSDREMTPTSLPSSVTGTRMMFFSSRTLITSSMGASTSTVMTSLVMMSWASVVSNAFPVRRTARIRSSSVTIPTTLPSL